jgi:hypothetical protein
MEITTQMPVAVNKKLISMKRENELVLMVTDLKQQLKIKNGRLIEAHLKLRKAKDNVQRLKGIITYQRERIVKLYGKKIVNTTDPLNKKSDGEKNL